MAERKKRGFHHRRLRTSAPLQRTYDLLESGVEKTTLELILEAGIAVASTTVSELNYNGCDIRCRRRDDGRFAYRMHRGVPWRKGGKNLDEAIV